MARNKLPDEQKKVRINISVDPTLVKRARELGMYNFSKYCEIAIRNFCNKHKISIPINVIITFIHN